MRNNQWGKLAFTSVMGLVLSSTFVFLAALPIRYMRLNFGRWVFLATTLLGTGVLLSFEQWQWAMVYACLNLLIGSYRELEERSQGIFTSSLVSIVTTTTLFFGALFALARWQNMAISQLLSQHLEPMMVQLQQLPQFKESVDMNKVIYFLPSGVVITLMLVTFVSLTFFGDYRTRYQNLRKLKAFTLPDFMIWFFILGLGGSFALKEQPLLTTLSVNVFAVTLSAYFFQGLAVFSCLLDRFGIFGLWRVLAYLMVVLLQMFVFICGLGILDYWFDFRSQLQMKNKKIGV
ncbi:MAG: DUF2232 domain-containing protein [Bdellovibrionales bacterium]|nr:YybS family protein [Bdellovibrionales bacterium]NQZ20268.1 DUF2232 domain-containing protein [Bdellovibrionales bacterium]